MKIIAGLLLFFLMTLGAVVGYVIPTEFHKIIHVKYLPQYTKLEKAYKKISLNQHQTILTSKKSTITIDSISTINPLENHVIVNFESADGKDSFKTKIRYEISKNIDILLEFENYTSLSKNSLRLEKPVLKISTPFDQKLLDENERTKYLIFNTSIEFLLEKVYAGWEDPAKPGNKIEFTGNNLSIGVGTKSPSPDLLMIEGKMAMASAEVLQNNVKNNGRDFSYILTLGSFNIPGILEGYKEIIAKSGKYEKMPFMFVLMQQMPTLRKMVNFPFEFTNSIKAVHEHGPTNVEIVAKIDNPEKGMMDIFNMTFFSTTPAKVLEVQATETFTGLFTVIYSDQFYPIGKTNPLFLSGFDKAKIKEKEDLKLEVKKMLPPIFTAYLNAEVQGKKRSIQLIDQIVAKNLMIKQENSFIFKGEFKRMQFSINGQLNPTEAIKTLIPQEELNTLMKENGLVSVFEGQMVQPEAGVPGVQP
jgi:hypothetical protein